ncbi:branched-chain amino acid ABC transporter permease [Nitratireductor indicus]|uniref:Branched-chain amino acid transport permease n=1 Tax=Nitratireductor indicus C115 TaxID=1231190 RepID=K2PLE9_9HYPH|nr:branched-chain amino acid ABC transporter permease [Nitratireductor indicus]EKF41952.1 branched-chain amino acid transport permease [Nitratireductor indicus C115]MDS1136639.1 branched-chain amino acid ABC transporter permease [Nitratireductor indicus]SFQ47823.1 branched-chain amino acid transport system permease protein [Nitratireductor indicus]
MNELLLQGLVNGIVVGLIYALIGVSLNVIFGVLRVVNFAHGEFIVLGAYAAYFAQAWLGLSPLLAMPLVFVIFGAMGYGLYFVLVQRLSRSNDPEHASLLVMFGLSLVLGALMLLAFEADARSLNFTLDPPFLMFGNIILPTTKLLGLVVAILVTGALAFFLYRTMPGKALRAIIMNRDAIQIVGVDLNRLSALTFGLGLGLAGITGILVSMIFPSFSPFIGQDYTLIGFIVIVLGGLGHPIGAVAGGILFGLAEQTAMVFFSGTVAMLLGFVLLIAVILLRPAGLFGVQNSR